MRMHGGGARHSLTTHRDAPNAAIAKCVSVDSALTSASCFRGRGARASHPARAAAGACRSPHPLRVLSAEADLGTSPSSMLRCAVDDVEAERLACSEQIDRELKAQSKAIVPATVVLLGTLNREAKRLHD